MIEKKTGVTLASYAQRRGKEGVGDGWAVSTA